MKLYENGAYLLNGKEVIIDGPDAQAAVKSKTGMDIDKQTAKRSTIAYVFKGAQYIRQYGQASD